ncbi:MAG: protein-disulfide reductase DsbD family protein [Verrucomicrobiota bacterium JB022]|nr:protein-disulfide reductase DsbD family protein [Verrucomicrobiota bacterium JB022]
MHWTKATAPTLPCWFLLACLFGLAQLAAAPLSDRNPVNARLVAEVEAVQPGQPFTAALELQHYDHWHTYWRSSQTGYATSLNWSLPEGWQTGELQWPVPMAMDFGGLIEYVYEGTVLLPVTVTPPADLQPGQTVTLRAEAGWLMCKEVCIPGDAELELTLPVVANTPPVNEAVAGQLEETRTHLPNEAQAEVAAWRTGDTVQLWVRGSDLPEQLYYFDGQAFLVPTLQPTVVDTDPAGKLLSFSVDPAGVGEVDRLQGVLGLGNGTEQHQQGWSLDVPLGTEPPAALAGGSEMATAAPEDSIGFAAAVGLAFVGGLILNLMPCVFPVLGLKVMGFVSQAGEERNKIVLHGLVFTAGVLISFWVLAGALLVLRAGGESLGWGFQLQSPVFVFFLALFLFAFALNMSGLFEVGQGAVGVGQGLQRKNGLQGSFFSGVLATVVATPCAAPFLAPALGSALTLPPVQALAVFTSIGIGLALPYLLLSAFPNLIKVLPKPGAWMEAFKQGMAFLLYATVAFLLWVLAGQLTEDAGYTPDALLAVLFALVVVALALWGYGRYGAFHKPKKVRYPAYGVTALLLLGAILLAYPQPSIEGGSEDAPIVEWQKWEPGKAEQLAAEGKIVYVDFTARWCVTCQTNKKLVFNSDEVRRQFANREVVALKADWTNADPQITEALQSFGKSAVPFNVIYGPGLDQPMALPEVLTPGIVLDRLNEIPRS